MARADIVVEVVLEGRSLELLDGAGRVEVLRALRRALLAVEAAPEAGVEDGLEVLFRVLVARVRRDALCLDEGKRIEEVLLVQRVLVAFRDARAAEDAAGVFLVFVKISRRLAAASSALNSSFGCTTGLTFLMRAYFGSQSTMRSRMTRKLPSGSIVKVSVW